MFIVLKKAKSTDNMHFEEYNFSCIYLVKYMGRYSSWNMLYFFLFFQYMFDLIIFCLKDRVTGDIGEFNNSYY